MNAPSEADWRALVERELKGVSFEKALMHQALPGVAVAPLYTSSPQGTFRELRGGSVRLCVRFRAAHAAEDLQGGADALWLEATDLERAPKVPLWVDPGAEGVASTAERVAKRSDAALCADPLGAGLKGSALDAELSVLASAGKTLGAERSAVAVSTVGYHSAGADAADELACALSTLALYLRHLDGPPRVTFRMAVGRDTFIELCKLRALRACHAKLLAAARVHQAPRPWVHAVCSPRTLTQRDPWVNMLRVTTQTFAAMVGGADLVTPLSFDEALGEPGALGWRLARNTALVLRDESGLDRVADPAGGAYAFENLTDALAREGWARFQALERDGGIRAAVEQGALAARFEKTARERAEAVARRKISVLGVGDFANLDEALPQPAAKQAGPKGVDAFPLRRDAEPIEALRARVEALKPEPALLLTLGSFAESRPRAGFAAGFFAAGGLRTREATEPERARIAVLCGTDERYTSEAAAQARALKAKGCRHVLLAGRPGALEPALREAGVDGFIFLGCDVVGTLAPLLEGVS